MQETVKNLINRVLDGEEIVSVLDEAKSDIKSELELLNKKLMIAGQIIDRIKHKAPHIKTTLDIAKLVKFEKQYKDNLKNLKDLQKSIKE